MADTSNEIEFHLPPGHEFTTEAEIAHAVTLCTTVLHQLVAPCNFGNGSLVVAYARPSADEMLTLRLFSSTSMVPLPELLANAVVASKGAPRPAETAPAATRQSGSSQAFQATVASDTLAALPVRGSVNRSLAIRRAVFWCMSTMDGLRELPESASLSAELAHVSVRILNAQADTLRQHAARLGVAPSIVLRHCITEYAECFQRGEPDPFVSPSS